MNHDAEIDPSALEELRAMIAQLREDAPTAAEVRAQLRGPRVPEQSARIKRRRAAKAARKRSR